MAIERGMMSRDLYYLKLFMSLLNFIILAFLSAVMMVTFNSINKNYMARNFLEDISYLPREATRSTVIVFLTFFLLLYIIEVRKQFKHKPVVSVGIYVVEIILCLMVIQCLYISYNGILLLVVADIVTSIRDKHNRGLFLVIMGLIYIFADYDIVSSIIPTISFEEILSVYSTQYRTLLLGIRNMLVSVNHIAFIAYMIISMKNQMKENARIALLNIQLQTANEQLKEMNEQLKDYAGMREKMGETKERNRIAREIHDTLGHTMTGLSVGIDACIAMIDYSIEGTKKQLNQMSQVARKGIDDIRRSVNKLRPDALEHHNLEEALEKLIEDTVLMSNVQIYYNLQVPELKFNTDEEDMIYRVVQEGITNAIRHGKADNIHVNIKKEDKWLILTIQDDGIGCEEIHTGFGLIHIEERIHMLNGEVSYNGSNGFCIVAKIPIRWSENYD